MTGEPLGSKDRGLRRPAIPLLLLLAALAASQDARGGNISLAWDPVPDNDLDGYRVYVGSTPGLGDIATLQVGAVTSVTLTGLSDCTIYYIGVRAVDRAGNLSPDFGNFVSGLTQPRIASATPPRLSQGAEDVLVRVTGASFSNGMQLTDIEFEDTEIRVLDLQYISCTELQLRVSAGPFLLNPGDPGYNGVGGAVEEVGPAQVGLTTAGVAAPDGSGGTVQGAPFTLLTIDLSAALTDTDGSGMVDGLDLARLGRAFGESRAAGSGYDPDVDFNGDETIDGLDLNILANYFARTF